MSRALFTGLFFLAVGGCALPADQVNARLPDKLPDNGPPQTYADLVKRARAQVDAADQVFFNNQRDPGYREWCQIEDAAKDLEQTAKYLTKATDVPAPQKEKLDVSAGDLGKGAAELRQAAKDQDPKKANEAFTRLQFKVRQLSIGK